MSDVVIDNIIRSQTVEDYLYSFEDKDLESIEPLLADDCTLTDWNVGPLHGKLAVIKMFSDLFEQTGNIEVNILHIHEDRNGIFTCEMELKIGDESILVADIIGFNDEDKIEFIRAYKG
tara:strand:+ start:5679 stop:6035 length:357 start_codon:yes stop_codon:yes gene_type:complete